MRVVESNRLEILEIVRRHRGRSVSVLGSVARGDERTDSDMDVLVEFEEGEVRCSTSSTSARSWKRCSVPGSMWCRSVG